MRTCRIALLASLMLAVFSLGGMLWLSEESDYRADVQSSPLRFAGQGAPLSLSQSNDTRPVVAASDEDSEVEESDDDRKDNADDEDRNLKELWDSPTLG
ncbi:MAG: hypothetical protein HY914_14900 [Desulfomonile tiedjei]|nr:hypothetical protein [Desulfomonile tiedjei]